MSSLRQKLVSSEPPVWWVGGIVAMAAVGLITAVIDPLQRVSADRLGRWSGLGPAITKGFIEASGGRVWAESLPGQGSTSAVELPLDDQPDLKRRPAGRLEAR